MLSRAFGRSGVSRVGSVLLLVGCALIAYSAGAYLGILPGGYEAMPEPVALARNGQRFAQLERPAGSDAPAIDRETRSASASNTATATHAPAASAPVSTGTLGQYSPWETASASAPVPKPEPADAADRVAASLAARPGFPVRLQLPSIKVDTEVKPGGLKPGPNGEPEWETLPFVAVNYQLLGPVGLVGNPVIAGHVVTLREGNVFRDLYQVELGEPIEVETTNSRFTYVIEEIKLVPPDAIDVMKPAGDARLTIITCGGTFDPRTRTFSDRLVVIGKLTGGERI